MIDNSKRTGAAVEAHYQFLIWLAPAIEKFPRSHKFTTGDRIESGIKRGATGGNVASSQGPRMGNSKDEVNRPVAAPPLES
jgi:hypothetical protein